MSVTLDTMSTDVRTPTPPVAPDRRQEAHGRARPRRRILLLSDCHRPAVNGVVASIDALRQGLLEAGQDVRLLTFTDTRATSFDGSIYRLPSLPAGAVYPHARLGRPVDRDLLDHVTRWGPQLVHSHTEFVAFWWARRLAGRLGAPHVHTYHTLYEDYTHYFCPHPRLGRAVSAGLTRRALRRTDHVIAPTAKIETLLRGYGVPRPISVVPTGVDLTRFRPEPADEILRRSLGLRPDVPVVLSVGRLAMEKNLTETITLLARLRDRPWQLVVVGDGPQAGALHDLVRDLHLGDRAHFTGAVAPETVHAYYRLGDIFVTSSGSETQGLTVLEALASGLPTLCRADPALHGVVIDGVNGWQYGDPDDFARTLGALLSDPTLRRRWSIGAADTAARFAIPRFVESVTRTYDAVSDPTGPRV